MPHKDPDEERKYQQDWYLRNRERIREQQREQNREKRNAAERARHAANKERRRLLDKAWYERNREHVLLATAEWRRLHPESQRLSQQRRRAKVSDGDFTFTEWQSILEEFDHRCAYCQGQGALEIEHMTPLSRGGAHHRDNIVPACGPCNRRKHTKNIFEFLATG